jgi:tetratricopeptide (TPR) repeat protein
VLGDWVGVAWGQSYIALVVSGERPVAAALALHRRAELALDPETSPRLYLDVQQNLVLVETELGRYREASRRLAEKAALDPRFADPATLTLRAWLEGRIARGLGQPAEAARHLTRARDAYLDQGLGLDAGLVSLDLADLYRETGRTADVKQLARAVEPIFRCQDVGREATAALILFQRAARAERLTAAFVTRLRGLLDRSRRNGNTAAAGAG